MNARPLQGLDLWCQMVEGLFKKKRRKGYARCGKVKGGKVWSVYELHAVERRNGRKAKGGRLTKTLAAVSPDQSAVMFKISVHDEAALKSFMNGSNPVSKPVWDDVMVSYEIFEFSHA